MQLPGFRWGGICARERATNEQARRLFGDSSLRSFPFSSPFLYVFHSLASKSRGQLVPALPQTRSSSVIDRNLSLTSLPPGAKILPEAQNGRTPQTEALTPFICHCFRYKETKETANWYEYMRWASKMATKRKLPVHKLSKLPYTNWSMLNWHLYDVEIFQSTNCNDLYLNFMWTNTGSVEKLKVQWNWHSLITGMTWWGLLNFRYIELFSSFNWKV